MSWTWGHGGRLVNNDSRISGSHLQGLEVSVADIIKTTGGMALKAKFEHVKFEILVK